MSFDLLFQQHAYTLLAAEFTAAKVDVFPPGNRALPYIQLGNSEYQDSPAEAVLTLWVHHWSSAEGPHEVKDQMSRTRGLLHGTHATASPWKFSCIRENFSDVLLDEDNETWHGVQRFTTTVSEA